MSSLKIPKKYSSCEEKNIIVCSRFLAMLSFFCIICFSFLALINFQKCFGRLSMSIFAIIPNVTWQNDDKGFELLCTFSLWCSTKPLKLKQHCILDILNVLRRKNKVYNWKYWILEAESWRHSAPDFQLEPLLVSSLRFLHSSRVTGPLEFLDCSGFLDFSGFFGFFRIF